MLKWLILVIVVVAAGWWGLRKYVLDHATEEGSFSSAIYEEKIEGQLLDQCRENHPPDRLPARRTQAAGRLLRFRIDVLEYRLDRAHDERQADEGEDQNDGQR